MRTRQQLTRFLKANHKVLRFLVVFALTFAACYFLFGMAPGVKAGLIEPYTHLLARSVAVLINLFGAGSTAAGAQVTSPRFSINIAMGCDGVEASSLFLAGV